METNEDRSIRIFLLGSQPVVIAGLRLLLDGVDGFSVVGDAAIPGAADDASDGRDVPLPPLDRSVANADVILFDLDGGTDYLLPVLAPAVHHGTRIMLVGSDLPQETLALAFRHRVTGAVLKSEPLEVLLDAFRHVHDGQVWLNRSSTTQLLAGLAEAQHAVSPEERRSASLTARERQVVALVGKGLTSREIADGLYIAEVTVRNHLTSIFRKLKLSNRFQLALYALRYGLSKFSPKFRSRRSAVGRSKKSRTRSASAITKATHG